MLAPTPRHNHETLIRHNSPIMFNMIARGHWPTFPRKTRTLCPVPKRTQKLYDHYARKCAWPLYVIHYASGNQTWPSLKSENSAPFQSLSPAHRTYTHGLLWLSWRRDRQSVSYLTREGGVAVALFLVFTGLRECVLVSYFFHQSHSFYHLHLYIHCSVIILHVSTTSMIIHL